MDKEEMKVKIHELVGKETDELLLIKILRILQLPKPKELSAQEIFAEVSEKYGGMMKKLANPDYTMQKKKID